MSPIPPTTQLRKLPRAVVVEALAILGFDAFEDKPTHVRLWGLDSDGEEKFLRLPGFHDVPAQAQRALLLEAKITPDRWLFAVAQAQRKLKL